MTKLSHAIIGLVALASLSASPLTSAASPADLPDDISGAILAEIQAYKNAQKQLLEERRAFAETLSDLSPAERRAAIEAYQAENAERLAAHRALGESIRAATQDLRQEGEPSPERVVEDDRPVAEPPSDAIKQHLDDFRAARDSHKDAMKALQEEMKGKTAEERKAAMAELRERMIEQRRSQGTTIRETIREDREDRHN